MKYSSFSRLRDIIFFLLLIACIKTAFDRTKLFITDHKESIIHELDRSFIDQIYTTQRQLHLLNQYLEDTDYQIQLNDLRAQLAGLEEKYKKNPAGLALLGPIGSAAIVAKEEKLQAQLLTIIAEMNVIAHSASHTQEPLIPTSTINKGLEVNKILLKLLENNLREFRSHISE